MASSAVKQPCVKCDKGGGVATCGGCQQWFCTKHFNEHRQELAIGMDNIGQEYDLLQRDLLKENVTHPLLSYVNDWEQKSITKIQAAAEQARIDVHIYLDHSKQRLKISLDQVTDDLKSSRQSDDYTEMDLKKWMDQMKEIREMLERPSTIRIIDNNDTQSIIHLIQVQEAHTTDRVVRSSEEASVVARSENGMRHQQYPSENTVQNKNELTEVISKVYTRKQMSAKLPSFHICQKCGREFNIGNNRGGDCIHVGTWHAKFEDCSYLRCGFNLGKKASIVRQHWSCCYSLEHGSNRCSESEPHTFIRLEN